MKQFFKFFFASLLAMIVAGILFFIAFFVIVGVVSSSITSSLSKEQAVVVRPHSVLYLDLRDAYPEQGRRNLFVLFTGGPMKSPGLSDVLDRIRAAKTDNKIDGIYLKAGGLKMGIASAQQLRDALKDFKTSGKFVYAYGDFMPQSDYFVTSVADSVFINPMGSLELKGLASNLVFFKGALDKLEIKPEIFYCGQFKSATEPFRMEKMSDPNRKQLAALQKDIWNIYLAAFSEHARTDTATVNSWAQEGAVQTGYDALSRHLIDGLKYKDEIEDLLKRQTHLTGDEAPRFVSVADYSGSVAGADTKDKIALLIAEGEITDGAGGDASTDQVIAADDFIKEIRKIRDDKAIKAVVMRVNSPGGSALASEVILRELNLLQKKKPLIVSMGDVAASGGYYIACQANRIFALPATITGSIGVFGMMFNTQDFFNRKLGVTFDEEKNAPYADMPNMNRPMTTQEKTFIQNGVDSVYMTFKSRVAAGRHRSLAYIDSIGQGRVWSGEAALQNGLVDTLGGLNGALQYAAATAGITQYGVETFPKENNRLNRLFNLLQDNSAREKIMAEEFLQKELGSDYRWFRVLRMMQEQKSHMWMLMPFTPEIR